MTWSLAILDDGITNAAQTRFGKATAVEYDFYYQATDTDDGVPNTHADSVYLSALETASAYDVIDYKVANAATGDYLSAPIEQALDQILAHPEVHVGAVNMSFGGPGYPYGFADEISQLADRGIPCVVAAGNGGTRAALEGALYPAALPDVICVGSQDGAGNPSAFSQNGPAVDILADGENFPQSNLAGTSFAAPQVAATVTQVEAIVSGLTGGPLGVAAVIDVLQEGGAGPRSRPDPADGATRYFLLDHQGSLDYAWAHYGGTPTRALEYIASYGDLMGAFGANPTRRPAAFRAQWQRRGAAHQLRRARLHRLLRRPGRGLRDGRLPRRRPLYRDGRSRGPQHRVRRPGIRRVLRRSDQCVRRERARRQQPFHHQWIFRGPPHHFRWPGVHCLLR